MKKFCFVVPLKNREKDVNELLNSYEQLVADQSEFVVVFIDDGSNDATANLLLDAITSWEKIVLTTNGVGPYSSRNIAIKHTQAEHYCFMDGYPDKTYVENLKNNQGTRDIVAGKIVLRHDPTRIFEVYDSIFTFDAERSIKKYSAVASGNLVIHHRVFEKIGYFEENIRSGGDIIFTSRAVRNGFSIQYNSTLISYYKARNWRALILKTKRVGEGQVRIWYRSNTHNYIYLAKSFIKIFMLKNPLKFSRYVDSRSDVQMGLFDKVQLYFIDKLIQTILAVINIYVYFVRFNVPDFK